MLLTALVQLLQTGQIHSLLLLFQVAVVVENLQQHQEAQNLVGQGQVALGMKLADPETHHIEAHHKEIAEEMHTEDFQTMEWEAAAVLAAQGLMEQLRLVVTAVLGHKTQLAARVQHLIMLAVAVAERLVEPKELVEPEVVALVLIHPPLVQEQQEHQIQVVVVGEVLQPMSLLLAATAALA